MVMDKAQDLHSFWSSFDLPAYDENTIPDDAQMPYITYSVATDSLDYVVPLSASVWYKSTSWEAVSKKVDAISEYIGNGGVVLPMQVGYLYISRGNPFAQRIADESNSSIRRIYINVNCEYLTDK